MPGPEIEWPIVWLLSGVHRKHIFLPQRITETNHINTDATRFTRRVSGTDRPLFFQAFIPRHVMVQIAQQGSVRLSSAGRRGSGMRYCQQPEGDGQKQSIIASRTKHCFAGGIGGYFEHRRGQRCRATKTVASRRGRDSISQRSTHKLLQKGKYSKRNRFEYDAQSVSNCCSGHIRQARRRSKSKTRNHETMAKQQELFCLKTENHVRVSQTAVSFRNVRASVGHPLAGVAQRVVQQLRRKLRECSHL